MVDTVHVELALALVLHLIVLLAVVLRVPLKDAAPFAVGAGAQDLGQVAQYDRRQKLDI